MDGLTFFTLILVIAGILGLVYVVYYNAFQKYLIKINEVESKIDTTLREQFDLLGKASDFIKEHINDKVMTELPTLEETDLSSFELERKLVSLTREFYDIKIKHRDLVKMESFTHMDFTLKENEAKLDGYTSYYNDSISKFNNLVRMFPSNIVAKVSHFKEKTFYDGKNMNDKNVNDFKL